MQVRVEAYSGYKADQRPLCFYLRDRKYQVEEVLDQWYGLEDTYFRVRAEDGNIYILRHAHAGPEEGWTLESFRRARVLD
jgi:hypothetical protein